MTSDASPLRVWATLCKAVRVLLLISSAALLCLLGWIGGARLRAALVEVDPRVSAANVGGRWVHAWDTQIHVQEWGDAEGKPVILVHGTGAWAGTWASNVGSMTAAGYRVVALDLPPFGYSALPAHGDYSRAAQAKRIVAVIDGLGKGPVTLLGHSFGGGPALEVAIQAPERVAHLILVDAAIGLQTSSPSACDAGSWVKSVLGWRPLRTALVTGFATEPVFSQFLLRQFVARKEAVTTERTSIYQEPFHSVDFSAGLGDWGYAFATGCESPASSRPEAVRNLRIPVSMIWGEADTITPMVQAMDLKGLMPQSTLLVLPGVGHIPHIEDIAAFNQALIKVLGSAR